MEWKRDWGLTARVWMTMFLLFIVYLIFMTILFEYGAGFGLIILLAVGFAFVQYFFSAQLVLWSTKARIVKDDEYPELHQIVEKLCKEADLPMPRIAIMPSPVPNAFATGRSPKHAVVACTDSILKMLNHDELEAVLAHELSHVKNRDILTMTLASFVAMIASMVMQSLLFSALLGGTGGGGRRNGGGLIIIGLASVVVWVVATLLMLALSRYREFAADRGSALITRNPQALISALNKITYRMDVVPPQAKAKIQGANAFFIIPALSGNKIMELFATHPPLEKRIAQLDKIDAELHGY